MNRLAIMMLGIAAMAMIPRAAALAALDLRIGPNAGAEAVDAVVAPGSGEHFFDLVLHETGAPGYEGLFAYDLMFRSSRPGLTLLRAEKPDNWVLTVPGARFDVREATADHILVLASEENLDDITEGTKAARVYYSVNPDALPGLYRITLDPADTVFGSGLPIGAPSIFVDVTDAGVVLVTPEPSGSAFLGAAVLLLGRRVGRTRPRA